MGGSRRWLLFMTLALGASSIGLGLLHSSGPRGSVAAQLQSQSGAHRQARSPEGSPDDSPASGEGPRPSAAVARVPEGEAATLAVPEASSSGLFGRVLGPDGAPLPKARVLVAFDVPRARGPLIGLDDLASAQGNRWTAHVAQTDAAGRFQFDETRPGPARLAVRADGCAPYDDDALLVHGGARQALGDLRLEAGARIFGTVRAPDGSGVAGARLRLLSEDATSPGALWASGHEHGTWLASSDENGRFELTSLASGPYQLLVQSEAYPDCLVWGELEPRAHERCDIRLSAGRYVRGTALGLEELVDEAGQPRFEVLAMPAARVEGSSGSALNLLRRAALAADGSFALEGLASEGPWSLSLQERASDGALGRELGEYASVRANATGVILRALSHVDLTFDLVPSSAGSAPPERLRLRIDLEDARGNRSSLESGPQGALLRRVNERWRALAWAPLQPPFKLKARLQTARFEPIELPWRLMPPSGTVDLGRIELREQPGLSLAILRASDGSSVAGASVVLFVELPGEDGHPATLERVQEVEAGPTGVALAAWTRRERPWASVRATGLAPRLAAPLQVAPGAGTESLALSEGGSAKVLVRGPGGSIARAVRVDAERLPQVAGAPQETWRARAFTDDDGVALFEHLPAGSYRLRAAAPGQHARRASADGASVECSVAEAEQVEVALECPAATSLAGTVRQLGRPFAGARVELFDGLRKHADLEQRRSPAARARCSSMGEFQLLGLAPGPATLAVFHPQLCWPTLVPVELALGENRRDVELSIGRLEGLVLDGQGQPLEGAYVALFSSPSNRSRDEPRPAVLEALQHTLGDKLRYVPPSAPGRPWRKTDPLGRFAFDGLPPGCELELLASERLHLPQERKGLKVSERGGTLPFVELRLKPAGELVLQLDPTGGSVSRSASVTVQCLRNGSKGRERREAPRSFRLREQVSLTIPSLAPGMYRATLQGAASADPAIQEVEIRAGQTALARWRLQ
jgi:protocatechuate 3,4-dioxygenase beta subunit